MAVAHRRKFNGKTYVLQSVESKSVARVLARQMRQADSKTLVRVVPAPIAGHNRYAIYVNR